MKRVLSILLAVCLLPAVADAQTVIKKGVKGDTLVKTQELHPTVTVTPRGEAIKVVDLDPPTGNWNFEASYGMAFGDQTTINIVPQARYSRSPFFSMGGGLSYSYYYMSRRGEKEKMNYLGLNLFARLTPFPYLAFQVQPELLQRWGTHNNRKVAGRLVPTLLAGGGFIIPAGPGSVDILFLYDIIQNDYTPYGRNLYYTIGYSFRI